MANGSLERVISSLQDDVRGIKFSADGQDLQIAVSGQSVQVYSLARRSLRSAAASASETPDPFTLALHRQGYISLGRYQNPWLVFSPDGSRLAQVSGNVLLWDVASHELIASLETPAWTNLSEAVFSPDGASLAAVSSDGDIWVWSALTGEKILFLSKADLIAGQIVPASMYLSVQGLAFSPDGRALLLGSGTQMELWDIHSAARLQTLEQVQPPAIPSQVGYSPDGQRIFAVFNSTNQAVVWDSRSGEILSEIPLGEETRGFSGTSPLSGWYFARSIFVDDEHWIEIWNLDTRQVQRIATPGNETPSLYLSPDGSLLATQLNLGIYFWKTSTGQLIFIHKTSSEYLAFSPDNRLLALGRPNKVELWDAASLAERAAEKDMIPAPMPPTATPMAELFAPEALSTPMPTIALTAQPTPSLPAGAISSANAARVGELFRFGDGSIDQVAWSGPDSFVTAGSTGVYQYVLTGGAIRETARFEPGYMLYGLALPNKTADGQTLAAGTDGKFVQVWDAGSGMSLVKVEGSGQPALSPDWLRLALPGSG